MSQSLSYFTQPVVPKTLTTDNLVHPENKVQTKARPAATQL
jgi:hypothetical protein